MDDRDCLSTLALGLISLRLHSMYMTLCTIDTRARTNYYTNQLTVTTTRAFFQQYVTVAVLAQDYKHKHYIQGPVPGKSFKDSYVCVVVFRMALAISYTLIHSAQHSTIMSSSSKDIHAEGRIRPPRKKPKTLRQQLTEQGVNLGLPGFKPRADYSDPASCYTWQEEQGYMCDSEHDSDHSDDKEYDPDVETPANILVKRYCDDPDYHEYTPCDADINSMWALSNQLRLAARQDLFIDNQTKFLHKQHLERHLDYLISLNTPADRGLRQMQVLCAGYSTLYQDVIRRHGSTGQTPDSWLRLLDRQSQSDSPGITKIATHYMPPSLIIKLKELPAPTQTQILSDMVAMAEARRKTMREVREEGALINAGAHELSIRRELKGVLIRNLRYHTSKHGVHDPPHIIAAQDTTVKRLCADIPWKEYSVVEVRPNLANDNSDLKVLDPPLPSITLPAHMSIVLRHIPKEHLSVIHDVARYPLTTTSAIIQDAPMLDPDHDMDLITSRMKDLCHRYIIRTRLHQTIDTANSQRYHQQRTTIGNLDDTTPIIQPDAPAYICPECGVPRQIRIWDRGQSPKCLMCGCRDPPIHEDLASPYLDWHTPLGTWRLHIPSPSGTASLHSGTSTISDDRRPYYTFIPIGKPPLTKEQTDALIATSSIDATFNHTTTTVPATQPLPTDSASTTTWADLGVSPENETPGESPPTANYEFHPLCHSLQHMQDQADEHGQITTDTRERPDQNTIPRQLWDLLESTNTQTRTWAQLLAKHTASNKEYTKAAKRLREERARGALPRPDRHRFRRRIKPVKAKPHTTHLTPSMPVKPDPTAARYLDLGNSLRLQGHNADETHPLIDNIPGHLRRAKETNNDYGFPELERGTTENEAQAIDLVIDLIDMYKGQVRASQTWWRPLHRALSGAFSKQHWNPHGNHQHLQATVTAAPSGVYHQLDYTKLRPLLTYSQSAHSGQVSMEDLQANPVDPHSSCLYHTLYMVDDMGHGYLREGHFWTFSTLLSDMGGNCTMADIIAHWESMPVITQPIKDRGSKQAQRDKNKIQNSARANLTEYLEHLQLLPNCRYLRHVAKDALKEYIIHDLYLRDTIDTQGLNLHHLPDLHEAQLADTVPNAPRALITAGENEQDARYRSTHDERQAVQVCQLPMPARRLLYPILTDEQLEDPKLHVVAELFFRCPRKYTATYKGKRLTLACGRTKRNTTSWIHWYRKGSRRPRHAWMCTGCQLHWARDYPGTRLAILRSPYHTVQYVCNEPSQEAENARSSTMAAYYRKVEGVRPRRDIEHYEDEPHRTTRFDITGPGNDQLTDVLFGPPAPGCTADWLYAMLTKRRHELPADHPDADDS